MHIVDRRSEALMLSRSQAGWIRAAREIYRVMLLAYPRTFRQAYGREMLLVFEDRARDLVRNRGSWALLCFAAGIVWDWLKTIVRERSEMRGLQVTRAAAAVQVALILPAALFMVSVVLRYLPRFHDGAQQIVMLYAGRMWTLWCLLLTPPLCVLASGCLMVLGEWKRAMAPPPAHHPVAALASRPSSLIVAVTTVAAAGILTTVLLHMLAN